MDNIIYVTEAIPDEVYGALVSGGFLLLTAYFAYKFGLQTYFRQRENEQVIERYLTEGIDKIVAEVEHANNTFYQNYAIALDIISTALTAEKTNCDLQLNRCSPLPSFTPLWRVRELIGDNIVGECVVPLLVFVDSYYQYLNGLLNIWVEKILNIPLEMGNGEARKKIVEPIIRHNDDFSKDMKQYLFILDEMQQLAAILEKQKLNWSRLDRFKKRNDIKNMIARMKSADLPKVDITVKRQHALELLNEE